METQNIQFSYVFRCDDKGRPSTMPTDKYFPLSDYDLVQKLKTELDSFGINYDLSIERFDHNTSSIISNDYIVENNHLNS